MVVSASNFPSLFLLLITTCRDKASPALQSGFAGLLSGTGQQEALPILYWPVDESCPLFALSLAAVATGVCFVCHGCRIDSFPSGCRLRALVAVVDAVANRFS